MCANKEVKYASFPNSLTRTCHMGVALLIPNHKGTGKYNPNMKWNGEKPETVSEQQ